MINQEDLTPVLSVANAQTMSMPVRLWLCFRPLLIGVLTGGLFYWAGQQLLDHHDGIAIFLLIACGASLLIGLMITAFVMLGHWGEILESAARTPLRRIIFGLIFALAAVGMFSISTWFFMLGDSGSDTIQFIIFAIMTALPGLGLALSSFVLLWKPKSPISEELASGATPVPLVHRGDPVRSMKRGWMLHLLGILILIGGGLLTYFSWQWTREAQWPGFVRLFLLLFLIFGSYFFGTSLIDQACRLRALSAKAIMEMDTRPPVLFLRSFTEDGADPLAHGIVNDRLRGRQGILFLFEIWRIFRGKDSMTFEEELASWFGNYGPFVAIGKPGEELATLGASRLYVDHNTWKEQVTELVANARWIVWQAGQTPGTWWELESLLLHVSPTKVILIAPQDLGPPASDSIWDKDLTGVNSAPHGNSVHEKFMARANELLPRPLPVMSQDDRLIIFDDQWNASTYPLIIRTRMGQHIHDTVIDLEATFQPFISRMP